MRKQLLFTYFLFSVFMLSADRLKAQSDKKELKIITSELNEIAGNNSFSYFENKALKLIRKGKDIFLGSNEQQKLERHYEKFIEVESQIKNRVKELYLNKYQKGKKDILEENIPNYYSTAIPREPARKLIAFDVDSSIEEDFRSLEEYNDIMFTLNNLYISIQNGIEKKHIAKFDSINTLFKKNKYYKKVDMNFEENICKSNKKYLETFKLNIEWIAEHVEKKSRPLNDIKQRFSQSERIAEIGFIRDSCLDGYNYMDTLAKYEERIQNFNIVSDKLNSPKKEEVIEYNYTESEKEMDCAVAKKFLEITDALKSHFSKNRPNILVISNLYDNGIGTEYFRSYRNELNESATKFYDKQLETIGMIIYDIKNGTNANRSSGMVMEVSFVSSDIKKRENQLCKKK